MTTVFVTRPAHQAAPLAEAVTARGHLAVLAPALTLRFVDGESPDPGDGVAVTSVNGVAGLARRMAGRAAPVFAVGAATAAAARAEGFAHVESADGDGAALARLIAARLPAGAQVLYPAGADAAFDLAGALSAQGIHVRQAVVYAMLPSDRLPDDAVSALKDGGPQSALLLSARSAAAFGHLVRAAGHDAALQTIVAVCLSEAVADAARTAGFAKTAVAATPTLAALLAALDAA